MDSSSSVLPPYADPVMVLAPPTTNFSPHIITEPVPHQARRHRVWAFFVDDFSLSFIILTLSLFGMYQIVLACYNCSLPDTSLIAIRISFFANFIFVLTVFLYVICIIIKKRILSSADVSAIICVYFILWMYEFCCTLHICQGYEMNSIRKTLQNATAIALLPCSASYYQQELGAMIAHITSPIPLLFINWCFFGRVKSISPMVEKETRGDRVITGISTLWRRAISAICRWHMEETIIQQF